MVSALLMAESATARSDVVKVLREDAAAAGRDPAATSALLLAGYRAIFASRLLADRLGALPQVGFFAGSIGDEGAQVGAALALRAGDWLFPSSRDVAASIARGVSIARIVHQAFGDALDPGHARETPGAAGDRALLVVPPSAPTAGHLTHAAGVAWADRARGGSAVALALFGEGVLDAAEIHNALNFAGVFRAPLIAVCKNAESAAGVDAEGRGVAYGVASVRCDGADLLAVVDTVRRAIAHAVAGEGPVLVECVVRRAATEAELDRASDPAVRLRGHLTRIGASVDELEREVGAEVDRAIAAAERAPAPDAASLFDDVYAKPPAHLVAQRAALLADR